MTSIGQQTIEDFGEQWTNYTQNDGYYGSLTLFTDLIEPLARPADFQGAAVADIGSGTGRIVRMLTSAGARRIVAVEPSAAIEPLRANTRDIADGRIEYLHARGDELPPAADLDWVVSFGVLHHIPEPALVVRAAFRALRPGGKMLVWLYGHEGNEIYLALARPLRAFTTRLSHRTLDRISAALRMPLAGYIAMCRRFPLPMSGYMVNHLGKLSRENQRLTIYDQLNPAFAKYYRRNEAVALLRDQGFTNVQVHHRHGYSWTVVGTRP
jgi:SAM-dependent methyltransferase